MVDGDDDRFEFGASKIHETDAAYLLSLDNGEEEWFPKSQLQWEGTELWSIPKWLAQTKDMA